MMQKSQILAFLGLSTFALQTAGIFLARRGCREFPGPGSPPCAKTYIGSGHVTPTPKPTLMPTPMPSDSLFPSCTCPDLPFGFFPVAPAPAPAPAPANPYRPHMPIGENEVEVITVDVRLANKVRCNNATLAKEVADLMHIPVRRVSVIPWSWSTDVPQDNYLAFVQEDHERCDCKVKSGKVLHGQGYRKMKAKTKAKGVAIDPSRAVMTVDEYRAMHTQQVHFQQPFDGSPAPSPASVVVAPPVPASTPARVQMLTRDPCLVQLLRSQTPYFKKHLAFLLGVPEDKLIVDPPPVRGTVGLLQLSTREGSQSEVRKLPVLGVQRCNAVEAADLEKRLHMSLLSHGNEPNFEVAAINLTAPVSEAMNSSLSISAQPRVSLVMKLSGIDYDRLTANWALVSSLTAVTKHAIGESGHIPAEAVKIALYPGSVVIEATITPPSGTAPEAILAFLKGTVCNQTATELNDLTTLSPVTSGVIDCSVASMSVENPPFPNEESNRAWVAFWNVVVLPPFAEEGAWRLLNLVNDPNSKVTKLLPLTLARVPGLKYRGVQEPNAANETRLPPPEDKAVGFALPDPYDKQAALQAERDRMAKERAAFARVSADKSAMELAKARLAVRDTRLLSRLIDRTSTKFTKAARAHWQALQSTKQAPDIMPYDVIAQPLLGDESPYPWREPMPHPSLLQDSSSARRLLLRGGAKRLESSRQELHQHDIVFL